MHLRKKEEVSMRALCAHLGPDDGVDPREGKRRDAEYERRPDRKLLQLCKQAAQTLQLALGGLPQFDALVGAFVKQVTPAPNAGRLCAVISVPTPNQREEVEAIVQQFSGHLRREIAMAITRSRVPEFTFEVIVEGGDHD